LEKKNKISDFSMNWHAQASSKGRYRRWQKKTNFFQYRFDLILCILYALSTRQGVCKTLLLSTSIVARYSAEHIAPAKLSQWLALQKYLGICDENDHQSNNSLHE
jgi:hypothetical protein